MLTGSLIEFSIGKSLLGGLAVYPQFSPHLIRASSSTKLAMVDVGFSFGFCLYAGEDTLAFCESSLLTHIPEGEIPGRRKGIEADVRWGARDWNDLDIE